MSAWRNSVTGRFYPGSPARGGEGPARALPAPPPLPGAFGLPPRNDLVRRGSFLRQHDLGNSVLPLADEELALRAPEVVPAQRSQDRVDLVVTEPVGELDLALALDRAYGLDRSLEHLRRRVGVGGVLRHLRPAEHLLVLGDELLITRRLGLLRVAHRVEDPFRRPLADRLGVLVAQGRGCRLVEDLRGEA